MTNSWKTTAGALLAAAVLAVLAGCSSGSGAAGTPGAKGAAPRTGKLKAVCTVGMIGDLAKRIGGEHVAVQSLMGPGVDPHLYKAREDDTRALKGADIILYNGLNLEGKMGDLFVTMARKKPHVYAVTETIDRKLLREPAEMDEHFDPHVWFDVSLWRKAAEQTRDALAAADPDHAADYKKNAEPVLKEFDELHAWCKSELAKVPKEGRVLITAHDAFGYFGRAYDVEVHGIQGISTQDEAAVSAINDLVKLIVTKKVKAVFVESSVPKKNIEALVEGCKSQGHQVVIGGELFSDAMGEVGKKAKDDLGEYDEGTYVGMVRHNVNTIVRALK